MKKKRDLSEFEEFDLLEALNTEDGAKMYLKVLVEDGDSSPEEVEDSWENIKRASERHGYTITPAMLDAYTEAMAAVTGQTTAKVGA